MAKYHFVIFGVILYLSAIVALLIGTAFSRTCTTVTYRLLLLMQGITIIIYPVLAVASLLWTDTYCGDPDGLSKIARDIVNPPRPFLAGFYSVVFFLLTIFGIFVLSIYPSEGLHNCPYAIAMVVLVGSVFACIGLSFLFSLLWFCIRCLLLPIVACLRDCAGTVCGVSSECWWRQSYNRWRAKRDPIFAEKLRSWQYREILVLIEELDLMELFLDIEDGDELHRFLDHIQIVSQLSTLLEVVIMHQSHGCIQFHHEALGLPLERALNGLRKAFDRFDSRASRVASRNSQHHPGPRPHIGPLQSFRTRFPIPRGPLAPPAYVPVPSSAMGPAPPYHSHDASHGLPVCTPAVTQPLTSTIAHHSQESDAGSDQPPDYCPDSLRRDTVPTYSSCVETSITLQPNNISESSLV